MLSKSLRNSHKLNVLANYGIRSFSVAEYDVAVIGGGPGGKFNSSLRSTFKNLSDMVWTKIKPYDDDNYYLFRICCCH